MVAIAVAVGLVLGQALHLAFHRLYTGESWTAPLRSCSACQNAPPLWLLVPLVGYLGAMGRCPRCRGRLPWRALVLPGGGAALFAVSALVFDSLGPALLAGTYASIFLALTLTDLERRLIPNRVVYPALLLAAALSWAWPDTSVGQVFAGGLVAAGIAAGILVLSLPFGADAFGMGDVKMIVLVGLVVGLPAVIIGVLVGTLAAGVAAVLLLLSGRLGRRDYLPHGPFLALGAVVALFWGQDVWDWYFDR